MPHPSSALDDWRRRDRVRTQAAVGVAIVGVVGILSAVSAPLYDRLTVVLEILPFHVPRAAASTLVLVSFALLLTARGLRRGQRLAWGATLALLLVSVTLNIAKGLDVEEAALALAAALWIAPHRGAFPVLPSKSAIRQAVILGVGGAVGALLLGTVLSMGFGRHHHPRLGESARAVAERLAGSSLLPLPGVGNFVTPALVAVGVGIVTSTLWVLLSPRQARHLTGAAHVTERERARAVVAAYGGGTLDYFALRDDKDWFFAGRSVVAHSVRRGVCLVSPDPIGPPDERELVWDEFMAYAERGGWSIAVIAAGEDWLDVYEASGLRPIYLGDEAIVDCATFSLDGRSMKSLRGAYGRVRRAGFTVTFVNPGELGPDDRAELESLAAANRRGAAERGYSMTLSRLFDPHDSDLMLTVVRDPAGVAQAFLQWVPAAGLHGWSLDVMRRSPDRSLPNGLIDFAVIATIFHVAPSGGALSLNFAVLREVLVGESKTTGARLSRAALRGVSGHAQVESLWKFNAKYDPRWQPRYAVLDSVEFMATQGLVMAGAEGVTELPVVGRFLGHGA
ncbi:MAG: bifunctional lysylphosphatidylglycerol flippase/synthetase MprF [Cellulomonas sp.]